ncbi:MAG: zinc-ribbon domain-containing protein [Ruminococcus sp.]|nr:zinc-ribbon domain-containing protein [Ruminococcus sp.]
MENFIGIRIDVDVNIIRNELKIRKRYASVIKNNRVVAVSPKWNVEKNNGMTPDNFSANAPTKVWWKCEKGYSWKVAISSRNMGNEL